MRFTYDFHNHSCLSPCGSDDMTPYNLVNMAKLCGIDIMALTDHNTAGNCRAAIQAGEEAGIVVVPGMELCCSEEIHVVCLFPGIDEAEAFSSFIGSRMPPIKNKPRIFGNQFRMDSRDNILSEEEIMLAAASSVSIEEARELVRSYGGFCYPAHIDRPSFSITASLGEIPARLGFICAEVSASGDLDELRQKYPILDKMRIMRSSDAHYLEDVARSIGVIDLPCCAAKDAVMYLSAL